MPLTWLLRPFLGRKHASPALVKWFYKTPEWKRLRYAHLAKQPSCVLCGRSAKDGARMNVDHIKPLAYHWNLRLAPHNLQTLCANCNHGKGGKTGDHRHQITR
jgi:5-methylcytosine-specific restriction endonuclease McrA